MTRLLVMVSVMALAPMAAAQPRSAPATTTKTPTSRPAVSKAALAPTTRPVGGATKDQELRFDALRIDGTLHGPEAVTIRSARSKNDGPLHAVRRSFIRRILQTVESPCLHR